MKQGEVFFHPMEGSGQLSISWSSAPKGAAVEANKGEGVGFFSDSGVLLSVIFDDVLAEEDEQVLEFAKYRVEIFVRNGNITHKVASLVRSNHPTSKHRRSKTKRTSNQIKL